MELLHFYINRTNREDLLSLMYKNRRNCVLFGEEGIMYDLFWERRKILEKAEIREITLPTLKEIKN